MNEPKRGPKRVVRGKCRACGCTEMFACPGGCRWTDATRTLCSACADKQKRLQGRKAFER